MSTPPREPLVDVGSERRFTLLNVTVLRDPTLRAAVVIQLLDTLTDVANIADAAARLGVSRPTLLKWRRATPELDARLSQLRYKHRPRTPAGPTSSK